MSKRELIDRIMGINRSADPSFLAKFENGELTEYLDHLRRSRPTVSAKAAYRRDTFLRQPLQETGGPTAASRMMPV